MINNLVEIIPVEQQASHSSDGMLVVTSFLGVLIGILFVIAGRIGRQMWIWVWGAGLIFASGYLGVSVLLDIRIFTYF